MTMKERVRDSLDTLFTCIECNMVLLIQCTGKNMHCLIIDRYIVSSEVTELRSCLLVRMVKEGGNS